MTEDADLFDTADSSAAILAFIYSEHGADSLKELLCLIEIDRESLERDSLELEQVDLPKPAQIVREFAKLSPAAIIKWNPYQESDVANFTAWREGYIRRRSYRLNPLRTATNGIR